MPIVIGAKPESSFSDPIGLLTDCHRRIEWFLSILVQVSSEAHGGLLTSGQRTSWETAPRYFREAAPQHTADEEETLFPRLRRLDHPEVPAVLTGVASLETEHGCAEESHRPVDRLGPVVADVRIAFLPCGGAFLATCRLVRTPSKSHCG